MPPGSIRRWPNTVRVTLLTVDPYAPERDVEMRESAIVW